MTSFVVGIPYTVTLFIIEDCIFLLKTNIVIFITKVVFGLNSYSLTVGKLVVIFRFSNLKIIRLALNFNSEGFVFVLTSVNQTLGNSQCLITP